MIKKISLFFIGLMFVFTPLVPVVVSAAIVPSCGKIETKIDTTTGKEVSYMSAPCDFTYFMVLINNIIKFLLFTIATPLAAVVICYAGWLFLTSGENSGNRTKGKTVLMNVIFGYIMGLAAWLVVNTIIKSLGVDPTIDTFLTN